MNDNNHGHENSFLVENKNGLGIYVALLKHCFTPAEPADANNTSWMVFQACPLKLNANANAQVNFIFFLSGHSTQYLYMHIYIHIFKYRWLLLCTHALMHQKLSGVPHLPQICITV